MSEASKRSVATFPKYTASPKNGCRILIPKSNVNFLQLELPLDFAEDDVKFSVPVHGKNFANAPRDRVQE